VECQLHVIAHKRTINEEKIRVATMTCCKPLSIVTAFLSLCCIFFRVVSERVYDEVLFTREKCEEFGYGGEFDVCAVMEFCSSSDEYSDDGGWNYESTNSMSTGTAAPRDGYSINFSSELIDAKEETWEKTNNAPIVNHAKFGWKIEGSTVCSWPGPILRLKRGMRHGLFARGGEALNRNEEYEGVATNLHFHGLHIHSTGNGDNSHRSVSGKDNYLIYNIDLPANAHHGGTHWYHSHVPQSAWEQVKGGAFGMIVIDENGHDIGTEDPHVLDFMNLRENERILILSNVGQDDEQSYIANGISLDHNSGKGEVFQFVKDEWYRMRILNVNAGSHHAQDTIRFGTSCTVHALAHDGIFRFTVPQETSKDEFILTSAARLDVAIRCERDTSIQMNGKALAWIDVDSSQTASSATPFGDNQSWQSSRLEYTKDLRSDMITPSNYWEIHMDETNINDLNSGRNKPLCDDNNQDFRFGSVQEWTVTGADTHPLHMHVYPMQVVNEAGGCGNGHDAGEYYDTIVTDGGISGQCWVRINLVDIIGPTLVHCHILEHAERGSSGWINVVDDSYQEEHVMGPSCIGTCEEEWTFSKCSD